MTRKLKIEEHFPAVRYGRPRAVPKVRLTGKWLQAAGFNPGAHLELTVVSVGVIELRVCSAVRVDAKAVDVMGQNDGLRAQVAQLSQVSKGALGYLKALPDSHRPDAAWFAPLSKAVAAAERSGKP